MLTHELLRDEGILILRPQGALQASDFTLLASVVDPYIQDTAGCVASWWTRSPFQDGTPLPRWPHTSGLSATITA